MKQDDALADLSNILGELKGMAIDMGSEIERLLFHLCPLMNSFSFPFSVFLSKIRSNLLVRDANYIVLVLFSTNVGKPKLWIMSKMMWTN